MSYVRISPRSADGCGTRSKGLEVEQMGSLDIEKLVKKCKGLIERAEGVTKRVARSRTPSSAEDRDLKQVIGELCSYFGELEKQLRGSGQLRPPPPKPPKLTDVEKLTEELVAQNDLTNSTSAYHAAMVKLADRGYGLEAQEIAREAVSAWKEETGRS